MVRFYCLLLIFKSDFNLFSVPIIPEFLYAIRHQNDRFTTPPPTTTTHKLQTPFGYNDTLYGNPAAPIDFIIENENDDGEDDSPSYSSDEYNDYESMDEDKLTPAQKWGFFQYLCALIRAYLR